MQAYLTSITPVALLRALAVIPDLTPQFRAKMRERRVRYGITQAQVGDVAGYSAGTVSYWEGAARKPHGERNVVTPKNLRDWIMALGILIHEVRTEHRPRGCGRAHRNPAYKFLELTD